MSEDKKRAAPRWRGDWSVFWILGGFVLTYFIYIPTTRDEYIPFPGYSVW